MVDVRGRAAAAPPARHAERGRAFRRRHGGARLPSGDHPAGRLHRGGQSTTTPKPARRLRSPAPCRSCAARRWWFMATCCSAATSSKGCSPPPPTSPSWWMPASGPAPIRGTSSRPTGWTRCSYLDDDAGAAHRASGCSPAGGRRRVDRAAVSQRQAGTETMREELAAMSDEGVLAQADLPALLQRLIGRGGVAVHYITGHWLDVDTADRPGGRAKLLLMLDAADFLRAAGEERRRLLHRRAVLLPHAADQPRRQRHVSALRGRRQRGRGGGDRRRRLAGRAADGGDVPEFRPGQRGQPA